MRSKAKKIAAFLAAAVIAVALVLGGIWFFQENYVTVDGRIHWINSSNVVLEGHDLNELAFLKDFPKLETLDARNCDLTREQYEQLHEEFPNCEIIWDVPFQGSHYSSRTEKLTVSALTGEDLKMLEYFPELKSVDAWDCEDYDALIQLQQRRPLCKVFYDVSLAGKTWDCDVEQLELENVDLQELEERLQYLPKVHTMHLTGELPRMSALQKVLDQYPSVSVSWDVDLGNVVLDLDATKLSFSDISDQDPEEIAKLISYLPALEEVDMMGYDVPVETVAMLARENPNVKFLCEVQIGPFTFSSDAVEIDLSGHVFDDVAEVEAVLPCFYNLEKVIMCNCGIPSEEMDALNKRYEDIRFVWSFWIDHMEVRTDAIYFMPRKYELQCGDESIQDLKYCEDMVCIDIGHALSVTHIEWAANMPNLKYLIIADTGVKDLTPLSNLKNLVFLEIFLSQVRDYTPLLGCTALEELNLCYTYGDIEPLTRMTWLKRLWIGNNWRAYEYKDAFAQNMPDCEINMKTPSSTGQGWRKTHNYFDMRDILGMFYMP